MFLYLTYTCSYLCLHFFACMLLLYILVSFCFFFFKQKTAYEMRISDWSSDVCSSDLAIADGRLSCIFCRGTSRAVPIRVRSADPRPLAPRRLEIGRASCRERVCQYV